MLAAANGLLIGGFYFSGKALELPMAFLPLPLYILGLLIWRWGWLRTLGFGLLLLIALFGLWRGVQPIWPLLSITAGLLTYDLDHTRRRWAAINHQPKRTEMSYRYLQRLFLVGLLGVSVGAAAMSLTIRLTFIPSLLLGLLAVVGLSQAVAFLRQESE
jgi:hypothetical protein